MMPFPHESMFILTFGPMKNRTRNISITLEVNALTDVDIHDEMDSKIVISVIC